jgi:hypothetical protein
MFRNTHGDSNNGMHLYPGEEILHQNSDFLDIRNESFGDSNVLFAVCQGSCPRELRPLSCRIYPFVPYIDLSGKLSIIEDPRAKYLCPLLFDKSEVSISIRFRRNILKVFRLLIQDKEIKDYVQELSKVLDEYARFVI